VLMIMMRSVYTLLREAPTKTMPRVGWRARAV
jgi:hypothetical protein